MKYKKYPSYKDSGVEWLGEIPSDWNESRLKFIGYTYGGLSGKAGKDFGDEENLKSKRFIPFTNIANNTFIKSDNLGYVIVDEKEEQNRVKANDLFFLMSSENYDDLGKASLLEEDLKDTYLNSFCKGFRLTNKLINPKFLNYLLSGNIYRKLLSIQGNGFTRINLRLEKLNELKLLLPNLREQQQIANFLDKATAKIDTLIEKQTKQIELLKEKRQAVISHAVTKGINPNVPMKDSGVEWFGEIPENWNFTRLKYCTLKIKAGPFGSSLRKDIYTKQGIRVYGQEQVIPNNFNIGDYYISYEYFNEMRQYEIQTGDILISCVGTYGKIALFPKDAEKGIINPRLILMRMNKFVYPPFIEWFLKSNSILFQMSLNTRGGTMDIVNISILSELAVSLPKYEEQQQIANYLDDKTSKIDTLIEKSKKSIELLKEKRTALISACVTGKIDIREAV